MLKMSYVLIRAPNIFMKNCIGGAEYVTLNWLKRFKKIRYEIVPDIDSVYLDLCINKRFKKDDVLEIIDKLNLPVNNTILDYYLDCKLHNNNAYIFKKILDNEIVLDTKIGSGMPVPQFFKKHILDFVNGRPAGYDFLYYSLKYSKKYIGVLQAMGDIPLSLKFYIYHFKGLLNYLESSKEFISLLANVVKQKTWRRALIRSKDKVHILTPSKGAIKKVGLDKLDYTVIFPYVGLDSTILNYYACKNKDTYAVFFARPSRIKGILEAIKIFKMARENGYLQKLYIIGGNLNDVTSKYKGETDVVSLGRISKGEVYRILSKAQVNIYPSISDAFGITILESLGVCTPVVMYYNEANYEYFSKSKLVRIVKPFNKYEFLNKIREVRSSMEMDEYTRNLVQSHLDWNRVVNNVEERLLTILDNIR